MVQAAATDRPFVIQLSERADRPDRRLSLPNTVYLDIAEGSSSQISTPTIGDLRAGWSRGHVQTDGRRDPGNYVEETIFYDPFEDRRIEVSKKSPVTVHTRRAPPLPSPNSSTGYPPPPDVYNTQSSDDGFRLPPLPVLDTPEPPPAYTEVDERNAVTPVSPVYRGQQLAAGSPRKLIICPSCGVRVYTIVIRESGALTHVIATLVLFLCIPVVFCVYLTDVCKYKNHYCPNCNHMIGYEIPLLCTQMVYTKKVQQSNP